MRAVPHPIIRLEGLVDTSVWLGSDRIPDEPVSDNIDARLKRCYELACYALLFGDDVPDGTLLIHGSIDGGPGTLGRIPHAWLRLGDGTVWEPINGDVFRDNRAYRAWASARLERHYTKDEARRLVLDSGHYGPWHRSPHDRSLTS